MDSFISQIPSLDTTDIASILRQVQCGSLNVEEQGPSGSSNQPTKSSNNDSKVAEPGRHTRPQPLQTQPLHAQIQSLDTSDIASILRQVQSGTLTVEEQGPSGSSNQPNIISTVQDVAETVAHTDPAFDPSSPSRHISLKRPGRPTQPLQTADVDIPVPQSKTELNKQIFQARMMGAPVEVTERITQKTGLGSPTKAKPNIRLSRSHHADHDREKRDHSREASEGSRKNPPSSRRDNHRGASHESNKSRRGKGDRSRSPLRRDDRRSSTDSGWCIDKKPSKLFQTERSTSRTSSTGARGGDSSKGIDKGKSRSGDQRGTSSNMVRRDEESKPERGHQKMSSKEKRKRRNAERISRLIQKKIQEKHMKREREKEAAKTNSESGNKSEYLNSSVRYLLSGLTAAMDQKTIRDYFGKFGHVTDIVLAPSQGCGYIEFAKCRQRKREERRDERLLHEEHFQYNTFIVVSKVATEQEPSETRGQNQDVHERVATKPAAVNKEPAQDRGVLAQVDRDAASFSMETFGQFKIPKKAATAATAAVRPKSADVSSQSIKKEDHKRGASHEGTGGLSQAWHGVSPKLPESAKSGGDKNKTESIVRGITGKGFLETLMSGDWQDNFENIRKSMPQIPLIGDELNREELDGIQREYLSAVREGKQKIENGSKELKEVWKQLEKQRAWQHLRADGVKKEQTKEAYLKHQKQIFKFLDLEQEFKAVSEEAIYTCFLCRVAFNTANQYCSHTGGNSGPAHKTNIACARTSLGRMFYIKYLQKIAKSGTKLEEQVKFSRDRTFCEVCMRKYTGAEDRHVISEKHLVALKTRPNCGVCDIAFNSIKEHHQHVIRQYHINNVQRKKENGTLSANYKDPKVDKTRLKRLEEKAAADEYLDDLPESEEIGAPGITEEGDSGDDSQSNKGSKPEKEEDDSTRSQHSDRVFFGETIGNITKNSCIKDSGGRYKNMRYKVKDACSRKIDNLEVFYSDLRQVAKLGFYLLEHLTKQDMIDVIDRYKSTEKDFTPILESERVSLYYEKEEKVRKQLEEEITAHSSIQHQWSLLCHLGLEPHIKERKDAMVDWYCYVCLRHVNKKDYAKHVKEDPRHHDNVAKAGSTLGNLFLAQILQSHLTASSSDCLGCLRMRKQALHCTECRVESPETGHGDGEAPSLFQNCCREFFGESLSTISSVTNIGQLKHNIASDREMTGIVQRLCSKKSYSQADMSALVRHLHIQANALTNLSTQDWFDVIDEYKTKMDNVYTALTVEYHQVNSYYRNDKFAEKATFKNQPNRQVPYLYKNNDSVPYQETLLGLLGVKNVSEYRLTNLFCYSCMMPYHKSKEYKHHLQSEEHTSNIVKAGTTLGNMFLVKYLQRNVDRRPDGLKAYCSFCDVVHSNPNHHKIGTQGHCITSHKHTKRGDVRCEACDMSFQTQEERREHQKSMKHTMLKVWKVEHGFLPSNFEEDIEETDSVADSDIQDGISSLGEYTRIEEELKAMGQEAMTEYIQGFFCVACNVFVNNSQTSAIKRTKKTHLGHWKHKENAKRYYQEVDKKLKNEEHKRVGAKDTATSIETEEGDVHSNTEQMEQQQDNGNASAQGSNSGEKDDSTTNRISEAKRISASIGYDSPKNKEASKDNVTKEPQTMDSKDTSKHKRATGEGRQRIKSGADDGRETAETVQKQTSKKSKSSDRHEMQDTANEKSMQDEKDRIVASKEKSTKEKHKHKLSSTKKGRHENTGTSEKSNKSAHNEKVSSAKPVKDVLKHAFKKNDKDRSKENQERTSAKSKESKMDKTGSKSAKSPEDAAQKHEDIVHDSNKLGKSDRSARDKKDTSGKPAKDVQKHARDESESDSSHKEQERTSAKSRKSKTDETNAKSEKITKDATQKDENVVWDSSIKLVRCTVVLKRLSAKEISKHCPWYDEGKSLPGPPASCSDDDSRIESDKRQTRRRRQAAGPKSSKLKAKVESTIDRPSSSSDIILSSDSKDLPLSAQREKAVKGRKLKGKGDVNISSKSKEPPSDGNSDSDSDCVPLSGQSKKTAKGRNRRGRGNANTAAKSKVQSSDGNSDSDDNGEPVSTKRKESVKGRNRKGRGNVKTVSKSEVQSSDGNSVSDDDGEPLSTQHKESVKGRNRKGRGNVKTVSKSEVQSSDGNADSDDNGELLSMKGKESVKGRNRKGRGNDNTAPKSKEQSSDNNSDSDVHDVPLGSQPKKSMKGRERKGRRNVNIASKSEVQSSDNNADSDDAGVQPKKAVKGRNKKRRGDVNTASKSKVQSSDGNSDSDSDDVPLSVQRKESVKGRTLRAKGDENIPSKSKGPPSDNNSGSDNDGALLSVKSKKSVKGKRKLRSRGSDNITSKSKVPSSDDNSDSDVIPLSDEGSKTVEEKRKLKKRSNEDKNPKRKVPSSDSNSDSDDLPLRTQREKSAKTTGKQDSRVDESTASKSLLPSFFDSSSGDSDIEELLTNVQTKKSSNSSSDNETVQISQNDAKDAEKLADVDSEIRALKRKLSLHNSSGSESDSRPSRKLLRDEKKKSKPKSTLKVKQEPSDAPKTSVKRTSSTEDSVITPSSKSKPAGRKEKTPSSAGSSSKTNVGEKSSVAVGEQKESAGAGSKKSRTSSSGSGGTNIKVKSESDSKKNKSESDSKKDKSEPDSKKRSSSVSSNPDAKQSRPPVPASEPAPPPKKVQSVDIADFLFRDSYSVKPSRKTVSSVKTKVKKTGDNSKPG